MTSEDLKAMRADLTAALGPMAAANVFFAWAEAIRVRMERERLHAAESQPAEVEGAP
jgi:hypothetical protein